MYIFRKNLIYESYYYLFDPQKEVTSYKEIDAVFASFPKKAYVELDKSYLSKTKSSKFKLLNIFSFLTEFNNFSQFSPA